MEQWLSNMAHIEAHNFEYALGHKTFSLGMNHYGDLSSTEFAAQYNGFLNSKKDRSHFNSSYNQLKLFKVFGTFFLRKTFVALTNLTNFRRYVFQLCEQAKRACMWERLTLSMRVMMSSRKLLTGELREPFPMSRTKVRG